MNTKNEHTINKTKSTINSDRYDHKNEVAKFRVTSKEKEIFDNYCKGHGMKFSELARKSIFEYIESHR